MDGADFRARRRVKLKRGEAGRKEYSTLLTEEVIEKALRANYGNVYRASLMIGCSRDTVQKWIVKSKTLQDLMREMLEQEIDVHEEKLRELSVDAKHLPAIIYYLNNRGRHRGWGKSDNSGQNGGNDTHYHLHLGNTGQSAKLRDYNDDELSLLIEEKKSVMIDVTPEKD